MASFATWAGLNRLGAPNAGLRAVDAWRRISDRSSSITLYRGETAQTAQTVRVEFSDTETPLSGAGDANRRDVTVFGVRSHPTVTDTSLEMGDQFVLDGLMYEIRDVILLPGEVQAKAVRIS